MSRIHHTDHDWQNLSAFADALCSLGPLHPHSATLSRWELGSTAVPYEAVNGYETLLGLRPRTLSSVFETVLRYHAPQIHAAPPLTRRRTDQAAAWARTEEVLRLSASGEDMTGDNWDELTALVTAGPSFAYGTGDLWTAACHRLLHEVMVSDGVSWMQRFEAFNRLLAHPVLGVETLSVLRDVVADTAVQSLVGTACMLDSTARPEGSQDTIRLLREPPDDRTFKGSLMACVRKIDYGHFTPRQLTTVSAILTDALADSARRTSTADARMGDDTLALASAVLRRIPAHLWHNHARSVLRPLTDPRVNRHAWVIADNSLAPHRDARATSQRLAHRATATLVTPAIGFVDQVLPVLVQETLFHPVFDVRLFAASLIHASPYRTTMARTLAEELSASRRTDDELWLTTLLEALRKLGDDRERRTVESLVVDPSAAPAVVDVAAYAMGHIGGTSPPGFWTAALRHHARAWLTTHAPTHASVLDRLVYALGQGGHRWLLDTVRADGRMPPAVRRSAQWWLDRPASP